MRNYLLIIVLILNLQTLVEADDIKDFQIEGMSVGDSLLDHFDKNEIQLLINSKNTFFYKKNEYAAITTHANFEIFSKSSKEDPYLNTQDKYDFVGAIIKPSDNKYIIYEISAYINYENDFEGCNNKKDEIVSSISSTFKDLEPTNETSPHQYDSTGESISSDTWFNLNNGTTSVHCEDWSKRLEEELGWQDQLKVRLTSKKFMTFLINKQYIN